MAGGDRKQRPVSPVAAVYSAPMKYLHTMVRVTDLDASLRFYCDALGLRELRRKDSGSPWFFWPRLGTTVPRSS